MSTLWKLIDADPIAATHPDTFQRPSREAIAQVRKGDWVKLIFKQTEINPICPGAERMWVAV